MLRLWTSTGETLPGMPAALLFESRQPTRMPGTTVVLVDGESSRAVPLLWSGDATCVVCDACASRFCTCHAALCPDSACREDHDLRCAEREADDDDLVTPSQTYRLGTAPLELVEPRRCYDCQAELSTCECGFYLLPGLPGPRQVLPVPFQNRCVLVLRLLRRPHGRAAPPVVHRTRGGVGCPVLDRGGIID